MRSTLQVALLLACGIWAMITQAQSSKPVKITASDGVGMFEQIRFSNKAKDDCTMVVSRHRSDTKMRVSCKTKDKSYWCDYVGKPNLCRAYKKNPRHYFAQIMWNMRKLQNSCQGSHAYKPHMCRSETEEAQMVFRASWPRIQKQQQHGRMGPTSKPAKPQQPLKEGSRPVKNSALKPVQPEKPAKTTIKSPTEIPVSRADQLAHQYCWQSLQGICSFFINLFE